MVNITNAVDGVKGDLEFIWGNGQAMLVVFKGENPIAFRPLDRNTEAEAVQSAIAFLETYRSSGNSFTA